MSAFTRFADSSLSLSSRPITLTFTGPAAGNVSDIVSAWKRIAASARTVEYTPHAPSHGSVRSSYLKPSTSRPLTNVSAQSLRLSMSADTKPTRSSANSFRSDSSIPSARFASKGIMSPMSASGMIVISTLPSSSVTISGLTISISSAAPSSSLASMPSGAAYKPFSIAIICL